MRAWMGVVVVVLALSGVACDTVSGSDNVVTRQVEVAPFSTLEVSDSFTVNVTVGDLEELTVRADDNLIDSVDAGVSGDALRIGLESGTEASDATLEADVTVTSLAALEASGSSTITLTDPLAGTLAATVSGASRLNGTLEIDEGSFELSGASVFSLSGSATALDVTENDASRLDALALTIADLTIDLSGASEAEVTVTGALSASASGRRPSSTPARRRSSGPRCRAPRTSGPSSSDGGRAQGRTARSS